MLTPGTRLGPYEIIEPLGAGGMGEVYRARDTRLRRDVALKIVSRQLTEDPSRRARFEHEAHALAALNHANVIQIYDVGTEDGIPYLVTELLGAQPLRGKLAIAKAVDAARQIASGLAAAHAAGIIHRDLKPDNVLRSRDGHITILDFGLAKIREPAGGSSESATTLTLGTEPGIVMGTIGYMSPEQVCGGSVDHRSDLFNLGLILHEMLTGERAFQRATSVETMHSILKEEAPGLPETIPAGLRQIVSHCLEKDPASRFQSAADLEFALAMIPDHAGDGDSHGLVRGLRKRLPLALVTVAVLFLLGGILAGRWWWRASEPLQWSGVGLGGPEFSWAPALSPDGHILAMAGIVDGCGQPVVMTPETGNYSILSHDRSQGYAHHVTWSADGSLLYFVRLAGGPRGIFSVPALGGEQRLVLAEATGPRAVSDGSLLVTRLNADRRMQVFHFWPESGRLQPLPFLAPADIGTARSVAVAFPDAREALVLGTPLGAPAAERPHLYVLNLVNGNSRRVAQELAADSDVVALEVSRNGSTILLSMRRGSLFEVVAVPRSGNSPARVLFTSTIPMRVLSGAPDGSIYVDQQDRSAEVIRFSPAGGPVEILGTIPESTTATLTVLPDGRPVVSSVSQGRTHLVAIEKGKNPVELLATSEQINGPFAANRGEIAFAIGPPQWQTIGIASLSSGRITRRIPTSRGMLTSIAFSPDGETIYFGAGGFIWRMGRNGDIQRIAPGESVAAASRGLVVHARALPASQLLRIAPNGGPAVEVEHQDLLADLRLSPNALQEDGRVLSPLAPVDSWTFLPGITGKSDKLERIAIDYHGDIHAMAWTPDGKVVALTQVFRSRIWKFSAQAH